MCNDNGLPVRIGEIGTQATCVTAGLIESLMTFQYPLGRTVGVGISVANMAFDPAGYSLRVVSTVLRVYGFISPSLPENT